MWSVDGSRFHVNCSQLPTQPLSGHSGGTVGYKEGAVRNNFLERQYTWGVLLFTPPVLNILACNYVSDWLSVSQYFSLTELSPINTYDDAKASFL